MAEQNTKTDAITSHQLASLAGVTPDAVRKWLRREKIETDKQHRFSLADPKTQKYIRDRNEEHKTAGGKSRRGHRTDVVIKADDPRRDRPGSFKDRLAAEERKQLALNARKAEAEVRKIEAAASNAEIKNQVARGNLGDMKFLQSLFFSSLHSAVRNFLTLPESTIDDIISLVLERGKAARTECINLQNSVINQIGVDTKEGWETNLKRIESDLVRMESLDD